MITDAELVRRRNFYFRNSRCTPIHKIVTVTECDPVSQSKVSCSIMIGWLVNFSGGFKHAFILAPTIGFDFGLMLRDAFPMGPLKQMLDGISIKYRNQNPIMDDRGDLNECSFTKRIFLFTGDLQQYRKQIKAAFRSYGLEAIIIDDQRWRTEWEMVPADVFICHDSRDKPRFARPLYDELLRRNFKVWLDEFSIRPGNDFVKKIDEGLSTSRHAILLLTKRFLQNDRWASQEMSALLNRQFNEKRDDLIIPVYIGISAKDVQTRSPLLAKAWAVRVSALKFQDRVKKAADEICRTVRP